MAKRSTIFEKVLEKSRISGVHGPRDRSNITAINWFRKKTEELAGNITSKTLMREEKRLVTTFQFGKQYFFYYDPKHKKTLPYYDTFPLVFPIGPAEGGFYGLNMHYIFPIWRARLMDALYDITNNNEFTRGTKLKITYDILQSASKFAAFRPCLKHYLIGHCQSKFLRVESYEWNISLFLPVAQFQKKSQEFVWRESNKLF